MKQIKVFFAFRSAKVGFTSFLFFPCLFRPFLFIKVKKSSRTVHTRTKTLAANERRFPPTPHNAHRTWIDVAYIHPHCIQWYVAYTGYVIRYFVECKKNSTFKKRKKKIFKIFSFGLINNWAKNSWEKREKITLIRRKIRVYFPGRRYAPLRHSKYSLERKTGVLKKKIYSRHVVHILCSPLMLRLFARLVFASYITS